MSGNSWFLGTCFCCPFFFGCKANPWSFRPTHPQALNFPRPVRWPWNISRGRCMKSWWKSRRFFFGKVPDEVMKRCTFRYTSPFFPQVFLGVKKVSKVHHLLCFHDCFWKKINHWIQQLQNYQDIWLSEMEKSRKEVSHSYWLLKLLSISKFASNGRCFPSMPMFHMCRV